MSKPTFSDSLYQTELMLGGIKSNQATLSAKGMDATFASEFEALHQQVKTLDREQERLKSDLRDKTELLNAAHDQMSAKLTEAKKRIKLELPVVRWKEFGIADSR